jgi:hypothetical protein
MNASGPPFPSPGMLMVNGTWNSGSLVLVMSATVTGKTPLGQPKHGFLEFHHLPFWYHLVTK